MTLGGIGLKAQPLVFPTQPYRVADFSNKAIVATLAASLANVAELLGIGVGPCLCKASCRFMPSTRSSRSEE